MPDPARHPADDRRADPVRDRRVAAGRGGRAGVRPSVAAGDRLQPARRVQQPRRGRPRRVRRRTRSRWSVQTAATHRIPLEIVNVGGGFGIDYTGDARFDLSVLGDRRWAGSPLPPGVRLVFELGRYLAADAGWYAAEVLDLKRTHGRWFAVLRGGTHHFRLPAAWGYSHPFTVRTGRGLGPPVRPAGGPRRRGRRGRRALHPARRAHPGPAGGPAARRRPAGLRPDRGVRMGHLAP